MLKRLLVAFLALLTAAVLFWCYRFFGPGGEVDQKSIYGQLQGIELYYRDKKIVTPFVLEAEEARPYRVAGFETDDNNGPYTWIALSLENIDNFNQGIYMVSAHAKLMVSCSQVQALLAKEQVSPAVSSFLKRHCRPQ